MTKLRVYTFPDLVLSKKAAPIGRVEKSLYRLADDMLETMYCETGIGLAANQVGILQRILVLDPEYDLVDPKGDLASAKQVEIFDENYVINKQPQIFLNPEIIYREGTASIKEGCLSVPEFRAEIKRAEKIKLQYQTIDGLTKVLSADGLLAIVIQHEIDHLDGKLMIDRLSPLKREMAKKKLAKLRAEADAAEAELIDGGLSSKLTKTSK